MNPIPILLALVPGPIADPIPVVVSTDIGCEVDDQFAIAWLALSPRFDLRAIVTAHAPELTPDRSAGVARELLDGLSPPRRPPVIPGSARPIRLDEPARTNAGVDRLLAESRGFGPDRRLAIALIGPATDVATALRIDPGFADRVAITAMAFEGWPGGGDPFNVKNDEPAWSILLDSTIPLTVVDATVTRRHLLLAREAAPGRVAPLGKAGDALLGPFLAWLDGKPDFVAEISGTRGAWPIWDLGVVSSLLGSAPATEHPRPRLGPERTLDHAGPARGTIRWVTAIDAEATWGELARLAR